MKTPRKNHSNKREHLRLFTVPFTVLYIFVVCGLILSVYSDIRKVDKTGAYLLLLWLLHDLTLSAHGVMVKNEPLAKKYLRQLKDSSEEALKIKFGD